MIGGKPAYLSGKPIQFIGRQGQIGVLTPGQGQQVLSGVSIVTQVCCVLTSHRNPKRSPRRRFKRMILS